MADRRVTGTGKDEDGDIISLCGAWGEVTAAEAISDLDSGTHSYYVQDANGVRADIQPVKGLTRRYLRTDPNSDCADNLDNLPDC